MASHFAENGSLTVNGGTPSDGREGIADLANSFMTAFPDMHLRMDDLYIQGDRAVYIWTFSGTNSGPGGTGNTVRFSGFEVWQISPDNLILTSRGYFDSAVYQEQLRSGVE
jgi:predicted ester cyclase